MRLGDNIDPGLFRQDYSGCANAAAIQAEGAINMGNQVAGAISDYGKQKSELNKQYKSGLDQIKAASIMFPEMKPQLDQLSEQLNDPNRSLADHAEMAASIGDMIQMGVGQKRYETELGFKRQDQENQNRESSMRQWAYGQQVTAAQDEAKAKQTDAKTKATIGPALLESVLKMAPSGIADNVRKSIGDYTPEEQFSLASSVMSLIPKSERKTAPTVQDIAVPGGSQKMQWDDTSGTWIPIQTAAAASPGLIQFVAQLEGFKSTPHADSGQTSIGFGTRAKPGDKEISQEEAAARLKEELGVHSKIVETAIAESGKTFTQNEKEALISFDFNTGAGASVIKRFAGDKKALVSKLAEYNKLDKGDAKASDGLVNRRNAEIKLFTTPSPVGFTPTDAAMSPTEKIAVQKYADEQQAAKSKESTATMEAKGFVETLDELEKHPGFENLFGSNVGIPTWYPGSSGADAKAILGKVQGKAFLEAIQKMKGMGALSEKEGETATKAYSALTPSMSEAAAKKEIATLKGILQAGISKASTMTPAAATAPPVDPITAASMKLQGLIPR